MSDSGGALRGGGGAGRGLGGLSRLGLGMGGGVAFDEAGFLEDVLDAFAEERPLFVGEEHFRPEGAGPEDGDAMGREPDLPLHGESGEVEEVVVLFVPVE